MRSHAPPSGVDRDWFKANRGRYDSELVKPPRELGAQLAHLGEPHMFRPYNDTRFHMRPPIKEQLGLAIGYGGAGGYYVELSLDGSSRGCTRPRPGAVSATELDSARPLVAWPAKHVGPSQRARG
jgi:hypothetical protein